MKTPSTLFLALLISLALAVTPAFAAISISLDKSTYFGGQTVTVTGSGALPNQAISVQLVDPNGNIKAVDQVIAGITGSFTSTGLIMPSSPTGTWSVIAGGVVVTLTLGVADTTPPTISSATVSPTVAKSGASITVTVTATDPVGIASVKADATSLTLTGSNWVGTISAAATEGVKTVTIVATDTAGNTASRTATYTVDNTAPTITVTSPVDGSKVYATSQNVAGTVSDNIAVSTLTVNGNAVTVGAGGVFSTTINLAQGANTITIVSTDSAGNTATKTVSVTFTTSPPLEISVDTGKLYVAGDKITVFLIITSNGDLVDPDSIVTAHVLGGTTATNLGTFTKLHQGAYKVDFTAPSQVGDYTVHVQAKYINTNANGQSVFTVSSSFATASALAAHDTSVKSAITTSEGNIRTAVTSVSTTVSAAQSDIKSAITASENNVKTAVSSVSATVSAAQTDIKSAITASENNVKTAVNSVASALSATESNLRKEITALSTSISSLSSSLSGKISESQNAVTTATNAARDDVKASIADLKSSVATSQAAVTQSVNDAKTTVSSMKGDLDTLNTSIGQTTTFVLVAALIAAIILVIQIAIIVRKK